MNKEILVVILGMSLVTYVPRLLPFLMVSENRMPDRLRRFLRLIPYTALGALILPGALSGAPRAPYTYIPGLVFVILVTWRKKQIVLPVLGAVAITALLMALMP